MASSSRTRISVVVGIVAALALVGAVRLVEMRTRAVPPVFASAPPGSALRGVTDQDQPITITLGSGTVSVAYDVIVACEGGGLLTRHEAFSGVRLEDRRFAAEQGSDASGTHSLLRGELGPGTALGEIRETVRGSPRPDSLCTLPNEVVHWTASRD